MNHNSEISASKQSQPRRASILKSASAKKGNGSMNKLGHSTAAGQTVTFRQLSPDQNDVRQFHEDSPSHHQQHFKDRGRGKITYSEQMLLKDVKFINNLFNNIFLMVSSTDQDKYQNLHLNQSLKQTRAAIEKTLVQNIHLNQQIEQQYEQIVQLHQLADYLAKTPEQLLTGNTLSDFLQDYCRQQSELEILQEKCLKLQQGSAQKVSSKSISEQDRKEKQRRCRHLRRQIEKENSKIVQLQKGQKQLLNRLYKAERQLLKNQRTSSALKIKINQMECKRSYKQIKNKKKELKISQTQQKENKREDFLEAKHVKIENRDRVTSKKSLAKFFRK